MVNRANPYSVFLRGAVTISDISGWCRQDYGWAMAFIRNLLERRILVIRSSRPLRYELTSKGNFILRWQNPKPTAYVKSFKGNGLTWTTCESEAWRFDSQEMAVAIARSLETVYPLEMTDKTLVVEKVK